MPSKKKIIGLAAIVPLSLLTGLGGGITWLGSESGNQYIAGEIKKAAATALPYGSFELGDISLNVLTGLELKDIHIRDQEGIELLQIDMVSLGYNLYSLPQMSIDDIVIDVHHPRVNIGANTAGEMRWNTLFEASESPPPSTEPAQPFEGVGLGIELKHFKLHNGQIKDGEDAVLSDLNIDLAAGVSPIGLVDLSVSNIQADVNDVGTVIFQSTIQLDGTTVELSKTTAALDELQLSLEGALSSIYTDPETDLLINTRLSPQSLAPLTDAPIPAVETPVAIDIKGPLSALNLNTHIENTAGLLNIVANLNLETEPLEWDLTLSSDAFKISDIVPNYIDQETTIAGTYRVFGSGTDWPSGINGNIEFNAKPQTLYGYDVENITVNAILEQGMMTLNTLSVTHDAVQLNVNGKANMVLEKADVDIHVKVPDLSQLADFGIEDLKGATEIEGPLSAQWGDPIKAEYNGDLKFRRIQHPSANILGGIGQIGVKYDDSGIRYRGRIALDDILAAGTSIETVRTDFEGDVSPSNEVTLNANVAVNEVKVGDGAVQLNDITGGIALVSSDAGMALSTEKLMLGTLELQPAGYVIDGGPIDFSIDGDDLKTEIILKRKGEDFVNVLAHGGLDTGIWSIDRFLFMPTDADPWSTKDVINLELKDDGIGSFAIDIEGNRGLIQLRNDFLDGEPSLYLGVKDLDVAYFEEVAKLLTGEAVLPPESEGFISAQVNLIGNDGRFGDDDFLQVRDLNLPTLIEKVNLDFEFSEDLTYPKVNFVLSDSLKRPLTSLDLHWPLDLNSGVSRCDDPIEFTLRLYPHPLSRYRETIPQLPDAEGMLSALMDIDGTPCEPNVHLSSAMAVPIGIYEKNVRIDSLIEVDKSGVTIDASLSQDLREQLYIDGHLSSDMHRHLKPIFASFTPPDEDNDPALWFDELDINVIFNELSIDETMSLLDAPKGLKGRIVGGVSIHGDPLEPVIEGGAAILNGRIGHTRISSANLAFESTSKHILIEGDTAIGQNGHALLTADIPKLDDGMLLFSSKGEGIPLDGALGLLPGVENADGLLQWDLNFNSEAQSETKFLAGIEGGSLDYVPIGVTLNDLQFKMESNGNQIILNSFKGTTLPITNPDGDSGSFSTSGIVSLDEGGLKEGTVHFNASEMWLNHTSLAKMAISGQTQMKFTPESLSVDGQFEVDEGQVSLDERFFVQDATLALNPFMKIYRGGMSEPKEVAVETQDESTYDINANIDIALNRRVRIKAAMPMLSSYGSSFAKLSTVNVDTILDGDLDIAYANDEIGIIGDILTPKGSIDMLGSTFLIDDGAVRFVGTDYANPELDMKATKRMPKYGDINIELTGMVSDLQPVFSEESGQYDDTDVMSLILFGKPVSELTESEGDGGSALLSSALSSVTSSIGGAIGGNMVDEVELNPTEGSFKIGKSLSEKLYLVYQKNMQAQEGENFNEFSLEWLIQSRLYAEFIAGDAMVSSADIYYRWIF